MNVNTNREKIMSDKQYIYIYILEREKWDKRGWERMGR
jgi:hypothetical protein